MKYLVIYTNNNSHSISIFSKKDIRRAYYPYTNSKVILLHFILHRTHLQKDIKVKFKIEEGVKVLEDLRTDISKI